MAKIKTTTTFLFDDLTPEEGVIAFREERDPQGLVLSQVQYNSEGGVEQRIERTYDEKGRVMEERQYSINEQPDQVVSFSYDNAGRITQQAIRYLDGSHSYRNYQRDEAANSETIVIVDDENFEEGKEFRRFDSEGRVLEVVIEEEGEPVQEVETSYDEHGRPLTQSGYYGEDYEFDLTFHYTTDEQGRISGVEVQNEEGELVRKESFAYDERGNPVEYRLENLREGYTQMEQWEYDMDNRMTLHRRALPDGTIQSEVQYRYGAHNLVEEEENLSRHGLSLTKYQYEFH